MTGSARSCFPPAWERSYPPIVNLAELGGELGIDPEDLAVLVTALGEQAGDELAALLLADLLDVLDAKTRLRG